MLQIRQLNAKKKFNKKKDACYKVNNYFNINCLK